MPAVAPFTYDVPCQRCPLRACEVFRDISDDELDFISALKVGELHAGPASTVF